MGFDIISIRNRYPILKTYIHSHPLIYLDNAATTQISETVLKAISDQYCLYESNVHRGIHTLSEISTMRIENVRNTIASFLGTNDPREIIFTSGTTESINLVARSFSECFLAKGDEIVVTEMEHHSNLIPWQEATHRKGGIIRTIPFNKNGELRLDLLDQYLTPKTKLVSLCAVSNVIGTVNSIKKIIDVAHTVGAKVFIDSAQAIRHYRFDVRDLDCDFLGFSGHKIMGPTGTGVLYGKHELLEALSPVNYGGGMVKASTDGNFIFDESPYKFEAGTPNISGIIALGQAISEFTEISEWSMPYETKLLNYTESKLREVPEVSIIGSPQQRRGVISFNIEGVHHVDVAALLDKLGIAVRSGHHCAQQVSAHYGISGSVRVSPAFYNTEEEIDCLISGLKRIISLRK